MAEARSAPHRHLVVVVKHHPPTRRISGIIGFLTVLLRAVGRHVRVSVISYERGAGRGRCVDDGPYDVWRVGSPFPVTAGVLARRLRATDVLVVSGVYQLRRALAYFAPVGPLAGAATTSFYQSTNLAGPGDRPARWALGRYDRVLGASPEIVADLAAAGGPPPIGLLPAVEPPSDAGPDGRDLDVVFVNHLNRVKGADVTAAAFARMLEARPELRLAIAGEGVLDTDVRATLDRFPTVEWYGWLDEPARLALLRRARTTVLPFRTSVSVLGVSQTVLEAMAAGCVVVGSGTPAVAAPLDGGRTGVVLDDATDPAGVATAVLALLDDHERWEGLSRAAVAAARDAWSVDARVATVLDLLGNTATVRPGEPGAGQPGPAS